MCVLEPYRANAEHRMTPPPVHKYYFAVMGDHEAFIYYW